MTGKERILCAFQHKEADRVPICEQAFASDVASEVLGRKVYTGSTSLHYEETLAWMNGDDAHREFEEKVWEDLKALTQYFEFDAVSVPWRMREQPTKQIDAFTFFYGKEGEKDWHINRFDPVSKNFGVVDSWEKHLEPEDIVQIMVQMEENFSCHVPLSTSDFPDLKRLLDTFGEETAVRGSAGIGIPCTPFWLESVLLYPEIVKKYLELQTLGLLESIKVQAGMGIKVMWGGGDMASKNGPFYSPKVFCQLLLPQLQKITALCNELSVYYLFRSDGNLWPVAKELFRESGIHGYGEIEGDAGMDLGKLKKEYGHLTFWGNISCHLLRNGTEKDVIEETKKCIDAASKSGGYIFGTSNSVLSGTPIENVLAMYKTAREYGKY